MGLEVVSLPFASYSITAFSTQSLVSSGKKLCKSNAVWRAVVRTTSTKARQFADPDGNQKTYLGKSIRGWVRLDSGKSRIGKSPATLATLPARPMRISAAGRGNRRDRWSGVVT